MLRLWKWREGHMPRAVGSSRSWKRQARKHILPWNFEEGHSPADTLMLAQGDPFWISELSSQVCYSSKRKLIHQRRTTYVVLYDSQMWLHSRITWRVLKMLMPGLNFYFNRSGGWTGHWNFESSPSKSEVQPGRWVTGVGGQLWHQINLAPQSSPALGRLGV